LLMVWRFTSISPRGRLLRQRTVELLTLADNDLPKVTCMSELAGTVDQIRAEHVGQAFAEGDAAARQVLEETAFLLTVWLGNVVDLLEPECIVVGGGMSKMMQPFFPDISKNLPKWSINQRSNEISIVLARYGPDAGIAGAAALVG